MPILSFIWVLYLKQENNLLRCFCNLFSHTLSSCLYRSKGIVSQMKVKHFVQNYLVKMSLCYVRTANWRYCYRHKFLLTLPAPCITESYIQVKIKFLFSHFFVVPQKVLSRPLRPSWNLLRHHREVWK